MNDKIIVVALGGNAIIQESEEGTIAQQFANTRASLSGVVPLIEQGYKVVLTHGNGPQAGVLLIRVEEALHIVPPTPLGVIDAQTQGEMGYMIAQSLMNKLKAHNLPQNVVAIVTQVLVDKDDPSIHNPDKFVGPYFKESDVEKLHKERGWVMKKDADRGWRRVVPSPIPRGIVEKDIIKKLVNDGDIVIASGGGGVPVYYEDDGTLEGFDAVIDKDRSAAILAREIGADDLIILTATENACLNYGTPEQKPIGRISLAQIKQYYDEGHFPPGSMGPKIEASINFIENGGRRAVITSLEKADESITGTVGTVITR